MILCLILFVIMAGLTQSELDDLAQTLEALDVKPDSGNPEEFKKWVLT